MIGIWSFNFHQIVAYLSRGASMKINLISSLKLLAVAAGAVLLSPSVLAQNNSADNPANRSARLDRTTVPCAAPPYPEEAKARGDEGRTVVGLLIGTDGTVKESRIDTSSGHALLDKTAQDAF